MLTFLVCCCALCSIRLSAQAFQFAKDKLVAVHVAMSVETLKGKRVVRVAKDSAVKEVDEPTFVKLKGVEFKDGTIEVRVLSKLQPAAPELARGFIGVAFRINEDNSKFECIYIRPANGRDSNQVRRNHAIQYFSYPDYKFNRLRKEAPEQYESYADMGLNEWIKMKIVVKGQQAKLFLNENREPSLIVNDLKQDAEPGAIGLWVDVGTDGLFSDVSITR
ncbi:hypothetical protein D4L85_13410 [Chryseolinea soli]|uniref:DUF1080 domain-containing protein n=2 Tax=Chryseolinea soli TaxID=2321403 RepID=A0A385T0A5_9BACT|nr:hypothetical protein D4L85_13410 [Chryseolinea soli]